MGEKYLFVSWPQNFVICPKKYYGLYYEKSIIKASMQVYETWHGGWGTKFGMIKCRTTDIPQFQNYEY